MLPNLHLVPLAALITITTQVYSKPVAVSGAPCTPAKPHTVGYFSTTTSTPNLIGIPLATLPSRNYTLVIPPNYDGTTPSPLIVSFHGHGDDATVMHSTTQWGDSTINQDYIVAYPQGLPGDKSELAWQGAPYAAPGVDDIGFVEKLLDYLNSTLCIDESRIYANGKSNGAGFVDTLACSSQGSRFAAFSAASAALYTDTSFDGTNSCNATRDGTAPGYRAPWLETHGSADPIISYDGNDGTGGEHGVTPPIPSWLSWWARRNGCEESDSGDSVISSGQLTNGTVATVEKNVTSWDCGGNAAVVQGIWLQGLGHDWPSLKGSHATIVDGSSLFLDFFANWTLSGV